MNQTALDKMLRLHKLWLNENKEGVRADFKFSNLQGANLEGADLSRADLCHANLMGALLKKANLSNANLRCALLNNADLTSAILTGTNLDVADLRGATLRKSDLRRASLNSSLLTGADITDVILPDFQIPQSGDLVGYKQVEEMVVLELLIPDGARRTASLGSNKCRCDKAFVVRALNSRMTEFRSIYDDRFIYRVGQFVYESSFVSDIREQCRPGIHFFLKEKDAFDY